MIQKKIRDSSSSQTKKPAEKKLQENKKKLSLKPLLRIG
jgi:hypothetical protein